MIGNKRRISYDNKGSALITALVVTAVLMVLSLSLLALSYSLYLSQKKNTGDTKEKEMFYSAIEVIEEDLLNAIRIEKNDISVYSGNYSYIDTIGEDIVNSIWEGFEAPNEDTPSTIEQPENCGKWLYYAPLTVVSSDSAAATAPIPKHNDIEQCSRYFEMDTLGAYRIIMQFYWELPAGWDGVSTTSKNGTVLHAVYRLISSQNNETLIKTDRVYRLGSTSYNRFIKFETSANGAQTDAYFLPDEIKFVDTNPPSGTLLSEYQYLDKCTFYTDSGCTEEWNRDSSSLIYDENTGIATVFVSWDDTAPLLAKFVLNGHCIDKKIYDVTKEPNEQAFDSSNVLMISPEIREQCQVPDDKGVFVGWKYYNVSNDAYENYFDDAGKPKALSNPVNYIYAVFTSDYSDGDTTDDTTLIPANFAFETEPVDDIIVLDNYASYSFERITG